MSSMGDKIQDLAEKMGCVLGKIDGIKETQEDTRLLLKESIAQQDKKIGENARRIEENKKMVIEDQGSLTKIWTHLSWIKALFLLLSAPLIYMLASSIIKQAK